MFFQNNLKLLRTRRKRSQADLAEFLSIKRSSLSGYELGTSFPNYETLIKISDFFKVSIDKLLRVDLQRVPELQLSELEKGHDLDLTGRSLRILATTINEENEENIELVNIAAKAGYKNGFADPDFIKVLPTFSLPFLSKEKKYRTFHISGDSMPPVSDGAFVTAEYLANWTMLKNGFPHIVITKDEGVVFKNVFNHIEEAGTLELHSTNPEYDPYEIHVSDVLEIWRFVNYIDSTPPEPNLDKSNLHAAVVRLQQEMEVVKNKLRE